MFEQQCIIIEHYVGKKTSLKVQKLTPELEVRESFKRETRII